MKDLKFAIVMNRDQITMYLPNYEYRFNDKEPVLTWPYHSQFVTEFCTFMVFDDVLTGYGIFLFKKIQKIYFCDVIN